MTDSLSVLASSLSATDASPKLGGNAILRAGGGLGSDKGREVVVAEPSAPRSVDSVEGGGGGTPLRARLSCGELRGLCGLPTKLPPPAWPAELVHEARHELLSCGGGIASFSSPSCWMSSSCCTASEFARFRRIRLRTREDEVDGSG